MSTFRPIAQCLVLAGSLLVLVRPTSAQNVAEVQVAPPELALFVDSIALVVAQVYDTRGTPIQGAEVLWVSSNVSVARVEPATGTQTATVIGVSEGITQIQARVGTVISNVVVQVRPFIPPAPEALPADSLPANIATRSAGLVVRLETHNFGLAQPCRVGAFVGPSLLLTSYKSIRGADSIRALVPGGGDVSTGVLVAAYDRPADLAVLNIPSQGTGEFAIGQNPAAGDAAWVVAQPECLAAAAVPVSVQDATAPGLLTLAPSLGLGHMGAPIIDRAGEIVGLAAGGVDAVRASNVRVLVNQARRNLASGALRTLAQVAAAERHAYGSVVFQSDLTGSVARVTPREDWHWSELTREETLPMSFAGPMGRYLVELLLSGAVQSTTEVTIEAGVADNVPLLAGAAIAGRGQQAQPQIGQPGGGGFPTALLVLGLLGGGGAAAYFGIIAPKAPTCPGDPGCPPVSTTGTIVVSIPAHN